MSINKLLGSIAIGLTLNATLAYADPGIYQYAGKGYTVTVSSDGDRYHGCDSKKRCIDLTNGEQIGEASSQWQTSSNYLYKMEQISGGRGKQMLKVYNPQRKLILQRVMTPLHGGRVISPQSFR